MTAPPVRTPERAVMLAGIQRIRAMLDRMEADIHAAEAQDIRDSKKGE